MRKEIFLDELPRGGKCVNKNSINWKESVGYKVKFIYDDIEGEIEIISYNTKGYKLTIKYKDKIKPISIGHFKNCQLGNILGKKTNDFKIEIGTTFKDNKRDITIIDREIREVKIEDKNCINGYTIVKQKWYKYKCNKDNNEDWIEECKLLTLKRGCNVCSGDKVTEYNCMWNTHRELCEQLGIPEEIARKVTRGSHTPVIFNCKCGNPVTVTPHNIINNKSIGCNCGDGISYPNKFIHEFCKQLFNQNEIKYFETEYKINTKKYDIFVELNNGKTLIIENQGKQHGKFIYNGDLLLVKEIKGFNQSDRNDIKEDIYKCKLAYENGIDNYIQLDCTLSDLEYIKHSIENSWLSKIFDLSNIDWNKCDEYALKNIVKEVCEYWKKYREIDKENITTKDLSYVFNLSSVTIVNYLKKGVKFNWCSYNPEEEKTRNGKKFGKKSGKKVLVYDLNMNYITEEESVTCLQKHSIERFGIYLDYRRIGEVATGKKPSYKGFIFKYAKYIDK